MVAGIPELYRFASAIVFSEIPLPGLRAAPPCSGPPDILIRQVADPLPDRSWRLCDRGEEELFPGVRFSRWRAEGERHRLRYEHGADHADFLIGGDSGEIVVHTSAPARLEDIATLLEGAVLGSALRLGGTTCLHANAVSFDGRAIAIAGPSGAGKSSLSWALVRHGCRLLADDLVTIGDDEAEPRVHPGRVRLRIWPGAAAALGIGAAAQSLFPRARQIDKRVLFDSEAAADGPAPLHAIYLLAPRAAGLEAPAVRDLEPPARLPALAANLYGMLDPGPAQRHRELALLAWVAQRVPVRELALPDDLGRLAGLAAQLRTDLFR